MTTIEEAKQFLMDNFEKGCKCPACGQFVKKYKIKMNYFMCHFLINLYKKTKSEDREWIHLNEIVEGKKTSGLYGYLCLWGLAEKAPNDDPKKKNSGFWRITEVGINFVEDSIRVWDHAMVYDNKLLGYGGNQITIREGLGNKFNYRELMGDYYINQTDLVPQSSTQESLL